MDCAGPAPLVGVSGIDASGKGFVAARLADALGRRGLRVALVPLDPWHAPIAERLASPGSGEDAGERFYRRAFRWDALFDSLLEPLQRDRAIDLTTELIDPSNDTPVTHSLCFEGIDLVLVEGIVLFRRDLAPRFDLRVWIDCTFETALTRAALRAQEGLGPLETRAEYERVYWPAQRLHGARDDPRAAAHVVIANDPSIG